jgi:hypothetical protein
MSTTYGLKRLEISCEQLQELAWRDYVDKDHQAMEVRRGVEHLQAEVDAFWTWFVDFFLEKGVRSSREEVAEFVMSSGGP